MGRAEERRANARGSRTTLSGATCGCGAAESRSAQRSAAPMRIGPLQFRPGHPLQVQGKADTPSPLVPCGHEVEQKVSAGAKCFLVKSEIGRRRAPANFPLDKKNLVPAGTGWLGFGYDLVPAGHQGGLGVARSYAPPEN